MSIINTGSFSGLLHNILTRFANQHVQFLHGYFKPQTPYMKGHISEPICESSKSFVLLLFNID